MEKHNILDKRQVRLEEIMKKDYIPFLSGRPDRELVINQDDITNLKIVLYITTTVKDFINAI